MLSLFALFSLVLFLSVKWVDRHGDTSRSARVRRLWFSLHESRRTYFFVNLTLGILLIFMSPQFVMTDLLSESWLDSFMRLPPDYQLSFIFTTAMGLLLLIQAVQRLTRKRFLGPHSDPPRSGLPRITITGAHLGAHLRQKEDD